MPAVGAMPALAAGARPGGAVTPPAVCSESLYDAMPVLAARRDDTAQCESMPAIRAMTALSSSMLVRIAGGGEKWVSWREKIAGWVWDFRLRDILHLVTPTYFMLDTTR